MLTLYEHPLSAYAMKVKMALLEKGLEFQAIVPDGMANGTAGGAFVDASPRAEIPALIDGDVKVFDSTIILEYLEDKWPHPPLLPQGAGRARARAHDRRRHGRPVRTQQLGRHGGHALQARQRGAGRQLVGFAKSNIDQLQHWLDGQLGGKPWFNGDSFGWGDIACAPYINRSAAYGYTPPAGSQLQAGSRASTSGRAWRK